MVCDEAGSLYPLLAPYADDIDLVDTRNLAQATEAVQEYPAHAIIINTASLHHLWPLVKQAKLEILYTPIIGCTLPPQVDRTLEAGANNHLIKPVTRTELEAVLQTLGKPVKHVLVVDDNPDIRHLLTRMLYTFEEVKKVTTVSSGEQALEELRSAPPDLVLLSIDLPGMDGWQVLKHKDQDEVIKDIPVIVVSADDFVEQPMYSEVLLTTIETGISVSQLLRCSLELSSLLLKSEPQAVPVPQ